MLSFPLPHCLANTRLLFISIYVLTLNGFLRGSMELGLARLASLSLYFDLKILKAMSCLVTQLYLTLSDPMDCSPPGSPVHGISQARILKWVASSFSRGSSRSRDRTRVSCITGGFFTAEPPGKPPQSNKLGQSFVSFTTRITVLCCLMSRLLTTIVSYISSIFFPLFFWLFQVGK